MTHTRPQRIVHRCPSGAVAHLEGTYDFDAEEHVAHCESCGESIYASAEGIEHA